MKRFTTKLLAAFLTFLIGISIVSPARFLFSQTRSYKPVSSLINDNSYLEYSFTEQSSPKLQEKESVSPYEIKQYIVEHKGDDYISLTEYWNRLGIETEAWKKYRNCKAELFKLQLDRIPGDEVVLRLHNEDIPGSETRYLIFKPIFSSSKTNWRFLGYVDVIGYFDVPNHKVITAGNHHWLVLTYEASHGSAFGLDYDEWYEVSNSGVKKVLSYPARKFVGFNFPTLETKANILSVSNVSGIAAVKIQFSAAYGAYNPEETRFDTQFSLWNKKQDAIFVKQLDLDEEFNLDSLQSNVSPEEIDTVYGGDSVDADDVIKYNYSELAKMATGKQTKRKEWLRDFLEGSSNTQEKERLQQILEK